MTLPFSAAADRRPWDPNEGRMALNRRPEHRTPIPRKGDHVLCRVEAFGPLGDAEVLAVQDFEAERDDPNNWHVVTEDGIPVRDALGRTALALVADPWPVLTLATDWGRITIREGRLIGAPGWWPLDWADRWYPAPGGRGLIRPRDGRIQA